MPLFGYPGDLFTVIHVTACVSLFASAVVSVALIVVLCYNSRNRHLERQTTESNSNDAATSKVVTSRSNPAGFWKWNPGERMVIYLAIADLGMGISHILDHGYILVAEANPPDVICSVFGFFLLGSVFSQLFMVLFTAASACSLVVFSKKLNPGRWDWRLILTVFGIPTLNSVVAECLGLVGQSGAWLVNLFLCFDSVNSIQIGQIGL